ERLHGLERRLLRARRRAADGEQARDHRQWHRERAHHRRIAEPRRVGNLVLRFRPMGKNAFVTIVLAIGFTTATYLGMHFVVLPHLPVHAVDVPSLAGLTPDQARGLLEPRGLLLILDEERPDERAAPGTLIDQRPLAGSR